MFLAMDRMVFLMCTRIHFNSDAEYNRAPHNAEIGRNHALNSQNHALESMIRREKYVLKFSFGAENTP